MTADEIRVLLIDDDEDDYLITSDYLFESVYTHYHLDWIQHYSDALPAILADEHDVYLIDLRLGERNGLELLHQSLESGCTKPLILLTGTGDRDIDLQAMDIGAADFLVKGQFSSQVLERSILYAMRHQNTLNELRLSETRYRTVIEAQHELICRFQPDTTLTFVNNAYARAFGMTEGELIGQPWIHLLPDNERGDVYEHLSNLVKRGKPVSYEHQVFVSDTETRWQLWTDHPILDEDGTVVEIQSVGIDITERKEAEITLMKALERERELGELKSRFVTMASHEFRTPLTTIMSTASFLEMANNKLPSEKRVARLQKIQSAADEMTQLLDDVLLFGKAEANRLDFQPKRQDVVSFAQEIIEDIQAGMGKHHQIQYTPDLQETVLLFDEKLMRQIITNLLTNAVKYSQTGSTVYFDIQDSDDAFCFRIRDEGIGIPEADQQHLFEPFHRAKNTRDISGTGLGLAITKKAVAMHNGTLTFESVANQGTTFNVTIPKG